MSSVYDLKIDFDYLDRLLKLAMHEGATVVKQARQGMHGTTHHPQVYAWLNAPDHRVNHLNACKKRQKATGSWFVQGRQFKEWKYIPNSFIWLHGIRMFAVNLVD